MTDKQINTAIAEACGYRRFVHTNYGWMACTPDADLGPMSDDYLLRVMVPNYVNDLNAMHEAEKMLSAKYNSCVGESQWSSYLGWLGYCGENKTSDVFQCVHATARQRAEAFLRTLDEWKEVQP